MFRKLDEGKIKYAFQDEGAEEETYEHDEKQPKPFKKTKHLKGKFQGKFNKRQNNNNGAQTNNNEQSYNKFNKHTNKRKWDNNNNNNNNSNHSNNKGGEPAAKKFKKSE